MAMLTAALAHPASMHAGVQLQYRLKSHQRASVRKATTPSIPAREKRSGECVLLGVVVRCHATYTPPSALPTSLAHRPADESLPYVGSKPRSIIEAQVGR